MIIDHWTLREGKAISLWAAYFEPQAVLEKLEIKLPVDGDRSTTSGIQDVSRKCTSGVELDRAALRNH
jgi:hypothetical protein